MNTSTRARTVIACLGLAAALLLPACTATIGPMSVHPNVALAPQQQGIRLVVGDAVADQVDVHPSDQMAGYPYVVQGWRTTLAVGFQNGFGSPPPGAGSGADLTLTLDEVRLEIGPFKPASARITYKATLSKGGVLLRRFAGVAQKVSGSQIETPEIGVGMAVEAMYEQIGKELSANPDLRPAA